MPASERSGAVAAGSNVARLVISRTAAYLHDTGWQGCRSTTRAAPHLPVSLQREASRQAEEQAGRAACRTRAPNGASKLTRGASCRHVCRGTSQMRLAASARGHARFVRCLCLSLVMSCFTLRFKLCLIAKAAAPSRAMRAQRQTQMEARRPGLKPGAARSSCSQSAQLTGTSARRLRAATASAPAACA